MSGIPFSMIEFSPKDKKLSIKNNAGDIEGSPFILNTKGVKIKVINSITLEYQTVPVPQNEDTAFTTEGFELKLKLLGNTENTKMFFGDIDGEFHLSWVGSDDIRVNYDDPLPNGILLMEGQILSFEILNTDEYLVIRHHKSL